VEHGHDEHGHDAHAHESHGHGESGREAHGHGAFDPHVWLAPEPVRVIADNMLAALVEADPAGAEAYRAGHARLLEEIERTDREVRNILADVPRGAAFLVYHPAFAYFARAYGLREVAIQQAGKEPSPRRLAELTEMAREKGVEAIFVEPQFSTREASIIADRIGAEVVEADPLAADWPDNLKRLARAFRSAAK
jgi:zinc transport system substrate-binding protein